MEMDDLFPWNVGDKIEGRSLQCVPIEYLIWGYGDRDKPVYPCLSWNREADPLCIAHEKRDVTCSGGVMPRRGGDLQPVLRPVAMLKEVSKIRPDDL